MFFLGLFLLYFVPDPFGQEFQSDKLVVCKFTMVFPPPCDDCNDALVLAPSPIVENPEHVVLGCFPWLLPVLPKCSSDMPSGVQLVATNAVKLGAAATWAHHFLVLDFGCDR